MSPERWQTIREAFLRLHNLSPDERHGEIERLRVQDPELVTEVESLLEQDGAAQSDGFLAEPKTAPLHESNGKPAVGARFGLYEVIRVIGSGGMGTVYLAARVRDYEQRVAVKVLRSDLDEASLRRFRFERQTLAHLEHPNIVRLLDGGETEKGVPYLVMEYIDGKALDVFCDEKNLSIAERVRLVRTVAQATAFAHEHNGLPVANGQKTTLSRRPARSERAKLGTSEVFCLEAVLAVGVDVLVPAWRQMSQVGLLYRVALDA